MTKRVVLVEDDPDIAALLREVISENGHHVDTFTAVEPGPPDPTVDLVITDLVAVRSYATEAVRDHVVTVRHRFPRAKVIVSTAHTAATRDGARALGADAVIVKPFDVDAFAKTVELLLGA